MSLAVTEQTSRVSEGQARQPQPQPQPEETVTMRVCDASSLPTGTGGPLPNADRLPRNVFRKQRKLDRRRRIRRQIAVNRQERKRKRLAKLSTKEAHAASERAEKEHEARKAAWERRELEIEEVNSKRRAEAEKKRKQQDAKKAGLAKATALAKKLASWIPPPPAPLVLSKRSLTLSEIAALSAVPAARKRRGASRQPPGVRRASGDETCPHFSKSGICPLGDQCTQTHCLPSSSSMLVFPSMFDSSYVGDDELEHNDEDVSERYLRFFGVIFPQLRKQGLILQFQCCRNKIRKLHGNVYVQYADEEQARNAKAAMAGRYHAGRRLLASFSPVVNWHSAVCGLFAKGCCPNGDDCNYIHLYHNPTGMFQQGILEIDVTNTASDPPLLQDDSPRLQDGLPEAMDWKVLVDAPIATNECGEIADSPTETEPAVIELPRQASTEHSFLPLEVRPQPIPTPCPPQRPRRRI